MIADGAIVNADINASAEIAVSKLANGTARQLLQTDSGGSGVEFTSNVDVPGTLDVTSAATFDSTVAVTGLLSANGKLAYPAGTAAAVSLYAGSDTDTGIYSPGSDQFGIATAGTSRIVVDATGKVGIGATSPARSLHVNSGVIDTVAKFESSDSAAIVNFVDSVDANGVSVGAVGGNMTFRSGLSQERMQIDSDGKLLLGLSSTLTNGTDAKFGILQIEGNSSNNSGAGIISVARGQSASSLSADIPLGIIAFTDNTGNTFASMSALADAAAGSDDYPGRLVFSTTADGAASPTERLRIDSSGSATLAGDLTIDVNTNGFGKINFKNTQTSTSGYWAIAGDADGDLKYERRNANGSFANAPFTVSNNGNATFAGGVQSAKYLYSVISSAVSNPSNYNALLVDYLGTQTAGIKANGSASFANTVSVQDPDTSDAAAVGTAVHGGLLVVKRESTAGSDKNVFIGYKGTDWTSFISATGSAQFKDGSSIVAGVNGGSAVFYGGDSNTTSQSNSKFRINTNGSATFANGAFDITASGTTQITNPASNADAIQVYGPGGNTVFARVKNNGDAYFGGKVGIGTTGPTELLGIGFADNSTGAIEFRTATYSKVAQIKGSHDSGTANGSLRFHTRNGGDEFERMKIASTGLISAPGVYSFTTASSANVIVESAGQLSRATSSVKYKRNVETLEDSYADAILNCRPVWYQSKSELDNPNYGFWGFIAEEVAEIDPRLVQWKTNEITYDENRSVVATPCEPEPESVAYDRFVPHLLNIIKRQQTAIENLEAKVAALEAG
jgi:hypothetical protein